VLLALLKRNLWWLSGLSVPLFVAGIVAVGIFVVRMPADYFCRSATPVSGGHPLVRGVRRAFKNLLGIVLAAVGVVMSLPLVPGPGLLMILIGVSLTDFPGKLKIEIWVIRKPLILWPVNRLRRKFGRAPLELPTVEG
jgi:hypothetical protein